MDVQIVKGPPVSKVSRAEAESHLARHPAFPRGAAYTLDEVEGRWIAAIASTKQAAPPFAPSGDGPPSGPPGGPPGLDGPPVDDEAPTGPPIDDESKPPSDKEGKPGEKKPGGEKGIEGAVQHLTQLVETLVNALGLGGPDGSPVPGPDQIPPPPHPAGPPAAPGDDKQHVVHERSLKPGEAAPGSTPVGAPSFASVREDHPWRKVVGEVRTFSVNEEIGEDEQMTTIANELHNLAGEVGYRIEQLHEERNANGRRIAKALVTR